MEREGLSRTERRRPTAQSAHMFLEASAPVDFTSFQEHVDKIGSIAAVRSTYFYHLNEEN